MKLYKFLTNENTGGYSDFVWPTPKGKPTEWLEVEGELKMCRNGFHLAKPGHLIEWIQPKLYLAEYDGEVIDGNKVCCRKVRLIKRVRAWNKKNQRLFACDCAERVLPRFEKKCPEDKRPRETIEVARGFAVGEATKKELAAAWAATRDATWDAAWAAARAAAWAVTRDAARAAGAAAWAAARDAARAAAWAAARDAEAAAEAAERKWQEERLLYYIEG